MKKRITYLLYLFIKSYELIWFERFRGYLVQVLLGKSLKGLYVRENVKIHAYRNLTLGDHVSINGGCYLSCNGGLSIGNYVAIGHNTSIITTEHGFEDPTMPIKYQPVINKPVTINNNVWIGANVTILGGVSLAEGTIVAAGAVVKKSFTEKNSIIGGVPAKVLKYHNIKTDG